MNHLPAHGFTPTKDNLEVLDRIRDHAFNRGVTTGFVVANVLWLALLVGAWHWGVIKA